MDDLNPMAINGSSQCLAGHSTGHGEGGKEGRRQGGEGKEGRRKKRCMVGGETKERRVILEER